MPRIQTIISSAFLSLALLAVSPANLSAQVFGDSSSSKAAAAILSAGSRAAAISRLRSVRSVGVVNLSFRNVPRFRTNAPDVSEFKVSAGKNISGIKRLAALPQMPPPRPGKPRHSMPWMTTTIDLLRPARPTGPMAVSDALCPRETLSRLSAWFSSSELAFWSGAMGILAGVLYGRSSPSA